MTTSRDLTWEGMANVRDLGGLTTADGRSTAFGAVVRSDHPSRLTPAGWRALTDHGIRTIVTLTTAGIDPPEIDYGFGPPADLTVTRVDVEDGTDPDFVATMIDTGLWATPFAFADALTRWPARWSAVVRAVATGAPGGVLVHCSRGCDRTGLAALLLLHLVGVGAPDIAADYTVSAERLRTVDPEHAAWLDAALAERGTTIDAVIAETLAAIDIEATLAVGGLAPADVDALRRRLLEA